MNDSVPYIFVAFNPAAGQDAPECLRHYFEQTGVGYELYISRSRQDLIAPVRGDGEVVGQQRLSVQVLARSLPIWVPEPEQR